MDGCFLTIYGAAHVKALTPETIKMALKKQISFLSTQAS
jgi:hypothetical protein